VTTFENAHFHPLANVFPLMDEDAFNELVADISQNGLTDPVVMLDGKILDGRNRWKACQQLGIAHREVKFSDLKLGSDDPAAFVWSRNTVRRHLTPNQRDMAAQAMEELAWGQHPDKAAENSTESSAPARKPKTRKEIAKETGATVTGMNRAKRVRSKGTEEVVKAVETGDLSLRAADRIAALPEEEQAEVMKAEDPAKAAARKEADRQKRPAVRKAPSPTVTMRGHMTGHQSGIRDVQIVHKYWAEHADEVDKLDAAELRAFIKDLEESRRAASQLLTLLAEKLIPEWTLPGKQPALLSTALNKIDQAESE
jgi:ParB-like chromosome segregation protein Spo0J